MCRRQIRWRRWLQHLVSEQFHNPFLTESITSGSCLEDKACDYDTGFCWDDNTDKEKRNCASGKYRVLAFWSWAQILRIHQPTMQRASMPRWLYQCWWILCWTRQMRLPRSSSWGRRFFRSTEIKPCFQRKDDMGQSTCYSLRADGLKGAGIALLVLIASIFSCRLVHAMNH